MYCQVHKLEFSSYYYFTSNFNADFWRLTPLWVIDGSKFFLILFRKKGSQILIFVAYFEGKFNLWNSKTRQMSKIQLVQHITVSNTLLCLAIHCLKNNTVSTLALNTVNSEIIAFIYYCDLWKFSQIAIFIIVKHEVLQYKWILMIPKCEVWLLRFHISRIFRHSKNIAIISEFTVYTCSTFLCWHNVVVCFALALRSPLFLFISLAICWHLTTTRMGSHHGSYFSLANVFSPWYKVKPVLVTASALLSKSLHYVALILLSLHGVFYIN